MQRASSRVFCLAALVLVLSHLTVACEKAKPRFECADRIGCVTVVPGEGLKIGVLQALSGKVAPLGLEQVRGTELALERRQGRVLGHSVAFQIEDTGCTAEGGANGALKLIADPQTVAIIGTTCSGAAAAASKVMSDAGLTMISGNNSAPFLTAIAGKRAPNWQPGYFRTAPNEENSGKAAAIYAFGVLGLRRAASINDGDIYTKGLTDGFGQTFLSLGGEVVLSASVNKGDQEMQPILTAVLNSKAQLLFFPLFQPEGSHLLLQARRTPGFERLILMSDGALIESSFIEAVQEQGKGMYFVGPKSPGGPAIDDLGREYSARYRSAPATSYYLSAYDAAMMLFEAIEKSAIQEKDGTLHIGRQALRDTLYGMKGFNGVTGSLTCDEFGDCSLPVFNVLRLDDPEAGVVGLQSNVMFTYAPGQP
ncbi:MAG: branched-chain amino acid ABC transporter substrate-binding protein [Syntrophobacteraceae bacterium]